MTTAARKPGGSGCRPCAPDVEVVVVGAGPAGSCVAGLLARRGHRIVLVDADGDRPSGAETLFTGMRSVANRLGLLTRLDNAAARRSSGISVFSPAGRRELRFGERGPYPYGHHVDRIVLDGLLLTRAAELGVAVVPGRVEDVLVHNGRAVGVHLGRGQHTAIRARVVVDASGPARVVASRFGRPPALGVVTSHLRADARAGRPPERAEHLLVERLPGEGGWLWATALADDHVELRLARPGRSPDGPAGTLRAALASSVHLQSRLSGIQITGPVHRSRFRAHLADRLHGPGWASVGDAGCALDPPLSGGATLAMMTAAPLAQAVHLVLRGAAAEYETLDRYAGGCRDLLADVEAHVRSAGVGAGWGGQRHPLVPGEPGAGLDALLCGMVGLRPPMNDGSGSSPRGAPPPTAVKNERRFPFRSAP